MTIRDWLRAIFTFVGVMGLSCVIWTVGNAQAVRTDNGGPLTWGYAASWLPCGGGMYVLTRRFGRQYPRVMAGIILFFPVLSACIAAFLAVQSGSIITPTSMNFPFLGASLGWHLAGGIRIRGEEQS